MTVRLDELVVASTATILEVIACIDRNETGIALVVDGERHLIATITDGDIRRAMLQSLDLSAPVSEIAETQRRSGRSSAVTAPSGVRVAELLDLMEREAIRHVPLLDDEGCVVDVAVLDDLVKDATPSLRAVVMAGGFGRRLGGLTATQPKPMLPVGERPLLERIITQLRDAGIRQVHVTTHYRPEAIVSHFEDGRELGVDIRYVNEDEPLGTAGSLSLLESSEEPVLVINGDILTRVDFRAMHRFHAEHEADMTVALRPYEINVPYGIVETEGELVREIVEKPLLRGFINAGIYLLNGEVCRYVPSGTRYDMPQLIERLADAGRRVVGFPLREYWLDIGTVEDYERALQEEAR